MLDRPSDQNYYEVLEISADAATEAIQAAYERARDVYASESVVSAAILTPEERREILERVTEAYHTLIAEDSRRLYDQRISGRSKTTTKTRPPILESPSPVAATSAPAPSISESSTAPESAYPRLVEIQAGPRNPASDPRSRWASKKKPPALFSRRRARRRESICAPSLRKRRSA